MKIGILIIGSLWWGGGKRATWRASRLAANKAVKVRVPIRYGRRSSGGFYTMTFAENGTEGTALVVPCQLEGDAQALTREAEELWGAEAKIDPARNVISTTWGSVGAKFRDGASASEMAEWTAYFRHCGGKAMAAVDAHGLLTFGWPQRVDGQLLECDVLLATTNREKSVVGPEGVADAWIALGDGEYFFENVRAGVRTPDDEQIWRRMASNADWIGQQTKYGAAIAQLQKEYPIPSSDSSQSRPYGAEFPRTPNYVAGMVALHHQQNEQAARLLDAEPEDSPCYALALANAALALMRLGRYEDMFARTNKALEVINAQGCPHPPTMVQLPRTIGDALLRTDRRVQSLAAFAEACRVADLLAEEFPDQKTELLLQKAITLNSWGAAFLMMGQNSAALERLKLARSMYEKLTGITIGLGEVLTHLSEAYRRENHPTEAGLALESAASLTGLTQDQKIRIALGKLQLGLTEGADARALIKTTAASAEAAGLFETAHTRYCMGLAAALKAEDIDWAEEALEGAAALESKLPATNLAPARVSFFRAEILRKRGRPRDEVIAVLLKGANRWCSIEPGRITLAEFQAFAGEMHDHFRLLSRSLLDAGRAEEAFVAFETGRARGFVAELRGNNSHPLVAGNPFTDPARVDTSLLAIIRRALPPDGVAISFAALPPSIVAFVVSSTSVSAFEVTTPSDLSSEISAIPHRLYAGKGAASIPAAMHALAAQVARSVGTQRITSLAPHGVLHRIPWRALLRHAGLAWTSLPFAVHFNPALAQARTEIGNQCLALGAGSASNGTTTIDLNEEAERIAAIFGSNGRFIRDARGDALATALSSGAILHVSCHGSIMPTPMIPRFKFDLADGIHFLDEIIPAKVGSTLIILSACDSGVFDLLEGDYPTGAAPQLLLQGAKFCIASRFPLDAQFSLTAFESLARKLVAKDQLENAFVAVLEEHEVRGADLWRTLACLELLGRGDTAQ